MLQEKMNHKECLELVTSMIGSVKEINRRMSELKWTIKNGLCSEQGKKTILEKIIRLNETKHCIIYSIYDVRNSVIDALNDGSQKSEFLNMNDLYRQLKDL